MKYQILICDDDILQAQNIARYIENTQTILTNEEDENGAAFAQPIITSTYNQAIEKISSETINGGIYFLDMILDHEKTGLDLAIRIKEKDQYAQIIFITTHDEMAYLTFQYHLDTLDYIIKTDNQAELQNRITQTIELAIRKLIGIKTINEATFSYKLGRYINKVNVSDILYIATTPVAHRLELVTKNGISEFPGNIKEIATELPKLVKISQSYLVNPNNIKEIDLKMRVVSFGNNIKVPFARSKKRLLKRLAQEYRL